MAPRRNDSWTPSQKSRRQTWRRLAARRHCRRCLFTAWRLRRRRSRRRRRRPHRVRTLRDRETGAHCEGHFRVLSNGVTLPTSSLGGRPRGLIPPFLKPPPPPIQGGPRLPTNQNSPAISSTRPLNFEGAHTTVHVYQPSSLSLYSATPLHPIVSPFY